MPYQVVLVQALHDDDDAASLFIVETRNQRMVVPVIYCLSLSFRECLIRLQGIVDDDKFSAPSDRSASNRNRQPMRTYFAPSRADILSGRRL
jgi:hypothetical protein